MPGNIGSLFCWTSIIDHNEVMKCSQVTCLSHTEDLALTKDGLVEDLEEVHPNENREYISIGLAQDSFVLDDPISIPTHRLVAVSPPPQ